MGDRRKAELKAQRQYIAVGAPLIAVGASLQTVAICIHDFTAQMIVRGMSILVMIVAIILIVMGILKGREARVGKGK